MFINWYEIKQLVFPFIKGLPVILLCCLVALLITKRSFKYIQPTYEATSVLKLDDSNEGVTNTILYKDFDLFHGANKIKTEAKVIQSQAILTKVVDSLNLQQQLKRIGRLKKTIFYKDEPLDITYNIKEGVLINKQIEIHIGKNDSLLVAYTHNNKIKSQPGKLGEKIVFEEVDLKIDVSKAFFNNKNKSDLIGEYVFEVQSKESVLSKIKQNLVVTELEKHVPIVRITYKDYNALRAKDVVNVIAEKYITDYIYTKTERASKTSVFIDKQIKELEQKLANTDYAVQKFKEENNIIDIEVSSETGLKKMAELQVKIANLQYDDVEFKREKMKVLLAEQKETFKKYPYIQNQLKAFNRTFTQDFKTYEYLKEKYSEAAIAAASTISFHRILKKAVLPRLPVSPNKILLSFIAGFLAFMFSSILVYIWHFISKKVVDEITIEKNSLIPVFNVLPNANRNANKWNSAINNTATLLANKIQPGKKVISFTSINSLSADGNIVNSIAKKLSEFGYKILYINLCEENISKNNSDFTNYILRNSNEIVPQKKTENLSVLQVDVNEDEKQTILNNKNIDIGFKKLSNDYDYVIINSSSLSNDNYCQKIHQLSDAILVMCKSNTLKLGKIIDADAYQTTYDLKNVYWLMNKTVKPVFLKRVCNISASSIAAMFNRIVNLFNYSKLSKAN